MEFKNIIFEQQEDGLAIITLNRPKAFNALCTELNDDLEAALDIVEADPNVRALIVTGGSKVFAAGADITEMMTADPMEGYRIVSSAHHLHDRIEALTIPTIAAMNGPAFGGGCELSLAFDFRIAGEGSLFGLPEVTLGIFPGGGGTQRLARLIGASHAKEMIFFGKPVKADKALAMGLVNQVVADAEVLAEAKKMASKLIAMPAMALKFAKEAINYGANMGLDCGTAMEKTCFAMICSTQDQKEGLKAFAEKRKPVYCNK